jgi:hypothetical protein
MATSCRSPSSSLGGAVIRGQWLTLRQLQRLHQEAFDEGVLCVVQMLRLTGEQYDQAIMQHPPLQQIADQISAILSQRQQQRTHE